MIGYKVTYRPATDRNPSEWLVRNLQTGKTTRVEYDYSVSNARMVAVAEVAGSPVTYIGDHSRGSYYVAQDN